MSNIVNESVRMDQLPIVVGAESEAGLREENQDHMTGFRSSFGAVYVIADGMGGHRAGAEASRMVTERVRTHMLAASADLTVPEAVEEAAQRTNRELFEKSSAGDPQFGGMGSTLLLVVITARETGIELTAAHVGDSRVYLQRAGCLSALTKDHTFVQRLVDSNTIDAETARTHPDASVLTRAMGQTPDVKVDISQPLDLQDGDGILLCSDGLSGYVPHDAIEETIRQNPGAADCAKALVQLALKSGSDDNITVQFVRLGNSPAASVSEERARPKRKTEPESEALPAKPSEVRYATIRANRRSFSWALAGALLLVCLAAGVYFFRSTFRTPPHPIRDQADKVYRQSVELSSQVSKDDRAVKQDLASLTPKSGQFPHDKGFNELQNALAQIETRMSGSRANVNNLGQREKDAAISTSGKQSKPGAETQDRETAQELATRRTEVKAEEDDYARLKSSDSYRKYLGKENPDMPSAQHPQKSVRKVGGVVSQ